MPLMLWYAVEPLANLDADRALALSQKASNPIILKYTVQKLGELNTPAAIAALQKLKNSLAESNSHTNHELNMQLSKLNLEP